MVEMLNENESFTSRYGDAAQHDFRPPSMLSSTHSESWCRWV